MTTDNVNQSAAGRTPSASVPLNRRDFFRLGAFSAAGAILNISAFSSGPSDGERPLQTSLSKPPNFLWLSAEDFSPHLGCYGDPKAKTPTIDQFAREGVRFTRAFTVHGVCAPVRSSIITGMYPTTLGSCAMRCTADIPEGPICFTEPLRQAGYYCTNNNKEDYNFRPPGTAWDDSSRNAHYKNRPKDSSFFAVFNFTGTHESRLWESADFENTRPNCLSRQEYQDPEKISVPPIFPDTPVVRRDLARLYEQITSFDHFVGEKLAELKTLGLEEETIVFIWTDHGDGLPRHKRWLYDTGTHVPLLVRIPERFRVQGQGVPQTADDRLINLLDLGPTVLKLAGLSSLPRMQGRPFAGLNLPEPAKYIFGARDRMSETFDLIRSVRDSRYRLIRNLNPWLPYFPYTQYTHRCNTMQELKRLHAENKLPPTPALWMADRRPAEELYDLQVDPYEICNLADNPAYGTIKKHLSDVLAEWMVDARDTGLLPEPMLRQRSQKAGSDYAVLNGPDGKSLTRRLAALAVSASNPKPADKTMFTENLNDADAAVRYWAIVGLGRIGDVDTEIPNRLEKAAADPDACVRIASARSLHWKGRHEAAVAVMRNLLRPDEDENVLLFALHVIKMMGPEAVAKALEPIRQIAESNKNKNDIEQILNSMLKK